jgi:hypothetical protein
MYSLVIKKIVIKILTKIPIKPGFRLGVLAHACNPSYSGGRDWED